MSEIAVLLGSKSDLKYWEESKQYLEYFKLAADLHILSAHRNPDDVEEFAKHAREKGYKVVIAAAGMAAHLAGSLAAQTDLPVLGVPLPGGVLDGVDALLSTVQMPAGVPVATFAVGTAGMRNAFVFSAQILSINNAELENKLIEFKKQGCRLKK
jgi:phosphoribosylaminoimidazole carboxylase PurE protein